MPWFEDNYWIEAAQELTRLSAKHRTILVPHEFVSLDRRHLPLGFGVCLSDLEITAFAAPKDDADRLPIRLLNSKFAGFKPVFANAVFVIYSSLPMDWVMAAKKANYDHHLPYFFDRVERVKNGEFFRINSLNPKFIPGNTSIPDYVSNGVLIINASHMGNFGDELLAHATVQMIKTIAPDSNCIVARPDFEIPVGSRYKAIVLAGGGVLYDYAVGESVQRLELENVSNYMRYSFLAHDLNIPFIALGLGDQHRLGGFMSKDSVAMVRAALSKASAVLTRDDTTANRLNSLLFSSQTRAEVSCDLAFCLSNEMRAIPRNTTTPVLGLAGQIAKEVWLDDFAEFLNEYQGRILFFVQANEDPEHYKKLISKIPHREIELVDLRSLDVAQGLRQIAMTSHLISTRFHALVCGLVMGIPVVAIDRHTGKKSRLLRSVHESEQPQSLVNLDSHTHSQMIETFKALVNNQLPLPKPQPIEYLENLRFRVIDVLKKYITA